jgi:uncharacterized protein (DUF1330 family)
MKAYAIGSVQMRDDSWVKDYAAKTEAIVARHGGRYLVRGATMEKLEGAGPLPHVMVVIEFPSMVHARAWHSDPEYAPLIKLRQAGCDIDLVLAEGM